MPDTSRRGLLKASSFGLLPTSVLSETYFGEKSRGDGDGPGQQFVRAFVHHQTDVRAAADAVNHIGGRVIHDYDSLPFVAARVPRKAAENYPHVTIREDARTQIHPHEAVSVPDAEAEWGIERIGATDAHILGYTGKGVDVGLIDTGVSPDHPDLKGNVVDGVNFATSDESDWRDRNGHGTHTAGIVGATDNDEGVLGVAPDVDIHAVRALQNDGSAYLSDCLAGIDWCIQSEVPVLSMSWGAAENAPELRQAVQTAYESGHLLVASAGNYGNDGDPTCEERNLGFPALYPEVIAVGSTTEDDDISSFSSVGADVELVAPGSDIRSTYKTARYLTMSGTSMACPHVAGVAAIRLQGEDDPLATATRDAVREELRSTAEPLGAGCTEGNGLVRADKQLIHL